MHTVFLLMACVEAINAAAGVMEVDLVFPRNETYAPTSSLPVLFAFQNSSLARYLNPKIFMEIWNAEDRNDGGITYDYDLRWANFSSEDPYFELHVFSKFNREGRWALGWNVGWKSCTEDSLALYGGKHFITNYTRNHILFTTKDSAQDIDLAAATLLRGPRRCFQCQRYSEGP